MKITERIQEHLIGAMLGVVLFAGMPQAANANVVTLNPNSQGLGYIGHNGDGSLTGPFGSSGFGVGVGTLNGRYQVINGHPDPSSPNETRGVAEFNLSGLLPATVNSASLSFVILDPIAAGVSSCFDLVDCGTVAGLNVRLFAGSGTVQPSDFNAGPASFLDLNPTPAFNITNTFDVTGQISGFLAGGGNIPSFLFAADSGFDGLVGVGNIQLTLDYTPGTGGVPEPSGWAMMLIGFGGLGAVLRSRRRYAHLATGI